MEVLLTSAVIADRVRYVLDALEGERYAIVAFVGARPRRWIKKPKGLHVYCWPSAGGTHPDGIDRLVRKKAGVAFVERLHSKVYHSDRGTVIGSANLSVNALGGALTETAVYLPPGAFPIKEQLRLLKDGYCAPGSREFADRLARLRIDHNLYRQRNPADKGTHQKPGDISSMVEVEAGEVQSFSDWYQAPNRAAWQLGAWTHFAKLPDDVKREQLDATGKEPENWIGYDRQDKFTLGVPTLECRFYQNAFRIRKGGMQWWIPDVVRETTDPKWEKFQYFFLAQVMLPDGVSVPFDIADQRFQKALSDAVYEFGDATEGMLGPVGDDFVEAIARYYFALS